MFMAVVMHEDDKEKERQQKRRKKKPKKRKEPIKKKPEDDWTFTDVEDIEVEEVHLDQVTDTKILDHFREESKKIDRARGNKKE